MPAVSPSLMREMVTSPGSPRGVSAERGIRWTLGEEVCLLGFDHSFNVMTWESGKCFQDLMSFAAEGSAMMRKFPPAFGSFVRVPLWQWSDFDWDMMMRFGSGISVREEIQGASFIFELEKKGWKMFEAPDSQGSMTIVNVVD